MISLNYFWRITSLGMGCIINYYQICLAGVSIAQIYTYSFFSIILRQDVSNIQTSSVMQLIVHCCVVHCF